jgi:hypothetical protein
VGQKARQGTVEEAARHDALVRIAGSEVREGDDEALNALDYLRERSAQFERELPGDCVTEACIVAVALIADGLGPWIGRIRDRRENYSGPLHAARFAGRNAPAWTTHYVCCAGDIAYDPLIGEPVPVSEFAERLFGRPLPVEHFVDFESETELRQAVRKGL